MPYQDYGNRKFFRLEGHSREIAQRIAQRIENIGEGGPKMTSEELADAQNYLKLFTGAPIGFPAKGEPQYYAICPALHRSQLEPDNYYLRVPLSDLDGSHITPLDAVEITDEAELRRLDGLFAEGADMIFMHQHSEGPFILPAEEHPGSDRDEGPQV